MEQIKEILEQERTQQGANTLLNLYKNVTGERLQLGCTCKSTNINKIYNHIQSWYDSNNN